MPHKSFKLTKTKVVSVVPPKQFDDVLINQILEAIDSNWPSMKTGQALELDMATASRAGYVRLKLAKKNKGLQVTSRGQFIYIIKGAGQ